MLSAARELSQHTLRWKDLSRLCVLERVTDESDTKGCGPVRLLFGFQSLLPWWAELRWLKERYVTTGATINAHQFVGLGNLKSEINVEAKRTAKWTTRSLVYPFSQRLIPYMPSIINHYTPTSDSSYRIVIGQWRLEL